MPETKPKAPKPLTDPADLLRLFSRFFASLILTIMTVLYIFRADVGGAVALGLFALLMQFWTIRLWRRLRDERMAAKAALNTAHSTKPEAAR